MKKIKPMAIALCGVLAGLAAAIMFLGGVIPVAAIACPVLASLVLIPVYCECGRKWGWIWYLAVSLLSLFLVPGKEAALLFVFLGYYPMLKKYFERIRGFFKWPAKFLYINAAVAAAYSLMYFVFRLESVMAELRELHAVLMAALILLANLCFFIYDRLIGKLEILYFIKLRPKLKL